MFNSKIDLDDFWIGRVFIKNKLTLVSEAMNLVSSCLDLVSPDYAGKLQIKSLHNLFLST